MSRPSHPEAVSRLLLKGKFRSPVDADAVRRDWQDRGFSCEPFADPPGREWRDFTHGCDELVTVIEGQLLFTAANTGYTLGPGDELLIPRGVRHSVKNIHCGQTYWLYGYN